MREVRVAKNRESIRRMNVRLLSAMNLEVQADHGKAGQYHLQTGFSTLLSSKYQEALLDIELEMSDDTRLPLREVDPEDYYLAIKSLDSSVIALAPSRDARFPRVIAVGNGQGQLLRTSLELIDNCMETKSSNLALAIQLAPVNVQFKNSKNNEVSPWPTENTKDGKATEQAQDMSSILSNIGKTRTFFSEGYTTTTFSLQLCEMTTVTTTTKRNRIPWWNPVATNPHTIQLLMAISPPWKLGFIFSWQYCARRSPFSWPPVLYRPPNTDRQITRYRWPPLCPSTFCRNETVIAKSPFRMPTIGFG